MQIVGKLRAFYLFTSAILLRSLITLVAFARLLSSGRRGLRYHACSVIGVAILMHCCPVASASPVANAPPLSSKARSLQEIEDVFEWLSESRDSKSISDLESETSRLIELRSIVGLPSLELISLAMIEMAEETERYGDREKAALLLQRAGELSPKAPRVYLQRAATTLRMHGLQAALTDIYQVLRWSTESVDVFIGLAADLVMPLLKAATLASFCLLGVALSAHFIVVARRVVGILPLHLQGIGGPLVLSLLLLVPTVLGLLQGIAIYSLTILTFLPERKRAVSFAGLLLMLWAIAYPTSLAVSDWFSQRKNHLLLQASENGAIGLSSSEIERTAAEVSMPRNARFALSLRYLIDGKVSKVATQLAADSHLLPTAAELELQAILFYARGDSKAADERYAELEQDGESSARFFINRATVKSKLLDSAASRAYLEMARALDPTIFNDEKLSTSIKSADTLKLPTLGFSHALLEVVESIAADIQWHRPMPHHVFSGYPPVAVLLLGALLFAMSILKATVSGFVKTDLYPKYRVVGLAGFHTLPATDSFYSARLIEGTQLVRLTVIFYCLLFNLSSIASSQLVLASVEPVLYPIYFAGATVIVGTLGYFYLARWWASD
jgi:hypothetical protein